MNSRIKKMSVIAGVFTLAIAALLYVGIGSLRDESADDVVYVVDRNATQNTTSSSTASSPTSSPTSSDTGVSEDGSDEVIVVEDNLPTDEPQQIFQEPKNLVLLDVPFTSQSPFRDWQDPRQQDGCEEASVLMTMKWVNGETLTQEQALEDILKLSIFQEETYGAYRDTSAQDTFDWLIVDYYGYEDAELHFDIGREDIIQALIDGYPVIVPVNGQTIGNKFYTQPGPERHMLVVVGYDPKKNEFITNDPGIGSGAAFRFSEKKFLSSLRDYTTGYHEPFGEQRTAMIVVKK